MSSDVAVPVASTGALAGPGRAGPERIEIITGHERRRFFADADKARLLAEAAQPGQTVARVAERHGVCPSLLYRWRRAGLGAPPRLLPVRVAAASVPGVAAQPGPVSVAAGTIAADQGPGSPGLVAIRLPNGCELRVDQHVDARALRRILGALRG